MAVLISLPALGLVVGWWGARSARAEAASSCPAAISGVGSGAVYYVSPTGSDGNSGTSPCAPWHTMTKVDSAHLQPGDTVAFEGDQIFSSSLAPWGGASGSIDHPIVYTSYGTGRAYLAAGVYLNSVADLTLENLNITNSAGPGIGTGATGTGTTNLTVRDSSVSSTYRGGIGGYGIGLRNTLDSRWTIQNDNISNTADSGVFSKGSAVTIDDNTLANDGIGPYCGTASNQNPCHAIYAKGPKATVTNNTITNPQSDGISLRYQNNIVQHNTISGGQKGIAFNSETTTFGTTYVVGNTLYGQSDTGIELDSGTQPVYESLVVASNTVYNSANYAVYIASGPNSASTQTVTLKDNLFESGAGTEAYLNLAYPTRYTKSTYSERHDTFYGTSSSHPFLVNGTARSWATYTGWFSANTRAGRSRCSTRPGSRTRTLTDDRRWHPKDVADHIPHVTSCPMTGSTAPSEPVR